MKKTTLYDSHMKLKAHMIAFSDFVMPVYYSGIVAEHLAVRQSAGLFDVSHMGEIRVKGPDAAVFLNYVMTNTINTMTTGQVVYTLLCDHSGGCLDDLLVYKRTDDDYLLVVNCSNRLADLKWLLDHSLNYLVTIEDVSEHFDLFALQGPKALKICEKVLDFHAEGLKRYHFEEALHWCSYELMLARTGYTGEDGIEIMCAPEASIALWTALSENPDVTLCGLGARDTLRFEAGMPLYGHELSATITPIEANLQRFVDFTKPFIGKAGMQKKKQWLIGLEMVESGLPRAGYLVLNENHETIGTVTTGYKSPSLGRFLAMAMVLDETIEMGDPAYVVIRNKPVKAKRVPYRHIKH